MAKEDGKKEAGKKKVVKKLKGKKLEDRIAPGMVGGGIIDPGMAGGAPEAPTDTPTADNQGIQTQVDQGPAPEPHQGDQADLPPQNQPSMHNTESPSNAPESNFQQTDTAHNNYQSDHAQNDYQSLHQNDNAHSGPVDDAHTWKEPDWVTPHADGSVHIQPPAGVTVDGGIANFPVHAANEHLPLPDNVQINANGSVDVALPQGTQFHEASNSLIVPAGGINPEHIPEHFEPTVNPDGSVSVALPDHGAQFDAGTNTLNLENHVVNEVAPPYMEVQHDGSVNIDLPEGHNIQPDGSVHLPADAAAQFDNPPHEALQDVDWAHHNPDGSVGFDVPQNVTVEDGIMSVPHDSINALPVPEGMTINADGTMDAQVPEGTTYNADANSLTFPPGQMNDVPQGIDHFTGPDGSVTLNLPEGMQYNADAGAVHMDNHWANEVVPDSVHISTDGAVNIELPHGTQFDADGSHFTIPADQTNFLDHPSPDYLHDANYSMPHADGSYTVAPPEGAHVADGTLNFSPDVVAQQVPMPEGVVVHDDGTMAIQAPEGTQYNADANALTFPSGSVHVNEFPEGVSAQLNTDGTVTAVLPQGVSYDPASGSVSLDNHWANEVAPQNVSIHPDGGVSVTLPEGTQYNPDGSFTVPAEHANFMEAPVPEYVANGPDWVSTPHPEGPVVVEPPPYVAVDPAAGTMSMPVASLTNDFSAHIPDNVTLGSDGTMSIQAPEGTTYNPAANMITIPAGGAYMNEIPPVVNAFPNPDGSISVPLQPGMNFNPDTGAVSLDNHWTNEVAPANVEIHPDGNVKIELPEATQFHDGGTFTVPADHANFIDNPTPEYVANGPDWINAHAPGEAVTFEPPSYVHVDPAAGVATMPIENMNVDFNNHIPDGMTFHADGTMDVQPPPGTVYNAEANVLTIPAGAANLNEIPPVVGAYPNPDGSITVPMHEGMSYDPGAGTVHCDNYWTNQITPSNVEIQPDGNVKIELPETTQFHEGGGFTVPADHAGFVDNPPPEFVQQGPEWVSMPAADGPVHVEPPPYVHVDPAAGVATMPIENMQADFSNHIPDGVAFHSDGTMEVTPPTGTVYNAEANVLTIPAGTTNINEIPPAVGAYANPDGSITVPMHEGMNYNEGTGTVQMDNHWTNLCTPSHVEVNPDGTVTVSVPAETQFHADGTLTIPADHANFTEAPAPEYVANGPDWVSTPHVEGPVIVEPPPYVAVDPAAGTMSMPVASLTNDFSAHIPDNVTLGSDGTMSIQAPEGTTYNPAANMITIPAGGAYMNEIPPVVNAFPNPDGSISVPLQPGMNFNPDTGAVSLDNHWTNEVAPANVEIQPDGNVKIELPEATQFHDGGSFAIPAEHTNFIENPAPEYVTHGPDWINTPAPGGAVSFEPPPYVHVDPAAGVATMPIENMQADFGNHIPDGMTFHADGTMDVQPPAGTVYNAEANTLTLPAGSMAHPGDMPPSLGAIANPDGSITVPMHEGMSYDPGAGTVHCDNYWTNQITPSNIEIHADGNVTVNLPPTTQYHDGGAFTVPAEHSNFVDNPPPEFVQHGPDWVSMPAADGPVHVEPPPYVHVDPAAGVATMPIENMHADFSNHIPDGTTFHADGTMEVTPPAGTVYNPGINALTIPAGAANINEIPPVVGAYPNPDGSITVPMHDGMNYNAGTGTVQMDNHWTNLCTPNNVEIHPDGNVSVNLPNATQFHDNGTFTIPAEHSNFVDNPPPGIVTHGPDWVDMHPSGAIMVTPPPTFTVDPAQGVMTAPFHGYVEHFPDMIPHDMTVHADGTATLPLPPGTDYNPAGGTLTMPPGTVHMNEIPQGINASMNPNGSITVNMPQGMTYDAGNVHMSNALVNQFVPPNVEITPQGHVQVDLPPGTQHFGNGAFTIPPQASNFMNPPPPAMGPPGVMPMGGASKVA